MIANLCSRAIFYKILKKVFQNLKAIGQLQKKVHILSKFHIDRPSLDCIVVAKSADDRASYSVKTQTIKSETTLS